MFYLQKSIYKETDEAKVGIWKLELYQFFLLLYIFLGRVQCWIGSLTWPPFTLVQDVPPLDVPELLACLVRQSEPFLDQIGVRKGKIAFFSS